MPQADQTEMREGAVVERSDSADEAPERATCDATGPFRGHRCTEPEDHPGDHQHHADGSRAVWERAG